MTETEFESIPETLPEELAPIAETAGTVANGEPPSPVPDPVNQDDQAKLEHYQEICRLNADVSRQQMRYESAKSKAKAEKEELEQLSLALSSLISEGPQRPDPQKELPFAELDSVNQEQPTEPAVDPEAWKVMPIFDVLKLTPKQRETLETHGIWTVGQFEHVRSEQHPDYPRGLRSIKGFGPATIDAMENDIVNWLAANAREADSDEPEETEEDAE